MEHFIETINARENVETALYTILQDNSRTHILSTEINNTTLLKDLGLPKAATAYDIIEDFGIDMAFEQIADFETVGDLVFFIQEQIQ